VVSAYVLIQTEVGKAGRVAKAVAEIEDVTADEVMGPYDVIAGAEAAGLDEISKLVLERIQAIEGVVRTLTCTVIHL
jgi:DNA-binding Lrp family transcriptional regulator